MIERGAAGRPGEHPRDLLHALLARDRRGGGEGHAVANRLGDRHLGVGGGGHLGEVRHDQHLVHAAEQGERITDRLSGRSTDPGIDLVIIDELGYVPLSQIGAEMLFEVISQRYERGSTIVTSNLPFEDTLDNVVKKTIELSGIAD